MAFDTFNQNQNQIPTDWYQALMFGGNGNNGAAANWGNMDVSGFNWGGSTPMAGQQSGLGWNVPTMQLGLSGLNTLGNLWSAWQSNKLAKDQFNFTKNFAQTNLANQTKSYNTALSDRAKSRGVMEGWTPQQTQAYIDQNKLGG